MDWAVGIIVLMAKWTIGQKNRWGWIMNITADVLMTILAVRNPEIRGFLIITIPSIIISTRNFISWSK